MEHQCEDFLAHCPPEKARPVWTLLPLTFSPGIFSRSGTLKSSELPVLTA